MPMLVTVLLMAVAVSVEPFRIGMTVLMLNRPRPALQLLAFLAGGFAMGTTVGLVVLFVFRRSVLGSSSFALPKVQILVGLLALTVAAIVAANLPARMGARPQDLATPVQRLLSRHSLIGCGHRRSRHRIAVGRLPCRAGRHSGLRGDGPDPSRSAVDVQRRGLRPHRDSAARLPAGTQGDRQVGGGAARLDSITTTRRRCTPAGRDRLRLPRGRHRRALTFSRNAALPLRR